MKINSQRLLKKVAKAAISIAMALVLAVGFTFVPAVQVLAEGSNVVTLSAGQTETYTWSTGKYSVRINVEETGFYELNVTDNSSNDFSSVALFDYDIPEYIFTSFSENTGLPISSGVVLLIAGHTYELTLMALNDYTSGYAYGNMTVAFSKSNTTVTAVSANEVSVEVSNYTPIWLSYTTSQAGDYCLSFTNFSAYIDVYNIKTGEKVIQYEDTEYDTVDGWMQRDKMVFGLDANTQYYFKIERYEPELPTNITFSMTKNEKTVKNIEIASLVCDIYSWYDIGAYLFDFDVTYTDNTSETVTYEQLALNGIKTPDVYYESNYIFVSNNTVFIKGGKVPVVSVYNDEHEQFYVNVISMTEWLKNDNAIGDYENYDGELINDGSYDEIEAYYRVKVSSTGFYDFVSEDWDKIKTRYMVVLDSKNNIVQYNEEQGGWPLVAGDEYAFGIYYYFIPISSNTGNVEFAVEKQSGELFPDVSTDTWYNDPVSYAVGRGVIKGYGNGNFGPGDNIQRQDFLVMLARLDGVDLQYYDYECEFSDVPQNSYYEAAINWGYEEGIVTGYENGNFGVGDNITREQIVAFLYRYAEYCNADTSINSSVATQISGQYSDYNSISDWAEEYVVWAIDKGVIKGKNETTIAPGGNALRCEIAQIMYNIFKNDIL